MIERSSVGNGSPKQYNLLFVFIRRHSADGAVTTSLLTCDYIYRILPIPLSSAHKVMTE